MIRCRVPAGVSGIWAVEKFSVSADEARHANVLDFVSNAKYGFVRPVRPGKYTRLVRNYQHNDWLRTTVMSDTPAELAELRVFSVLATGNVLITGLGLGIAAVEVLRKDDVEHLTVIEKSQDVINLTGPYLKKRYGRRLTIVNADAFTWQPDPSTKYDYVWHDIWDAICGDNLSEMGKLKRRFAKVAKWQGCWWERECRAANRRM